MYNARIFISSTFNDFTEERNLLHRNVFPRLEKLCREYGCAFHAVDLRWGISEEDNVSYTTLGICLNEIRRCMNVTPRPNFIFLAGDRYGWRPLPDSIPEPLYNKLFAAASPDDAETISRAYQRDTNAVPCEYCLVLPTCPGMEDAVRSALRRSAATIRLTEAENDLLFSSATHRELLERLKKHDFPQSAICAIRTLRNLPAGEFPQYYDLQETGTRDEEAHSRAEALKANVRSLTDDPLEYTLDFADSDEERQKSLESFAEGIYTRLEQYLLAEFRDAAYNKLNSEREYHEQERSARHAVFAGRDEQAKRLLASISPKASLPLFRRKSSAVMILTGGEGTGKSSMLAELYTKYSEKGKKAVIRFAGLTSDASDSRRLIDNLEQEKARESAVFIDGIEKLDKPARFVNWLFEAAPQHPLVLSMSDDSYEKLKKAFPSEHIRVDMPLISAEETEKIIEKRLAAFGRTLTPEQMSALLCAYRKSKDVYHLDLLLKKAITLKSFERAEELTLSTSRAGYAADLLNSLVTKMHFGPEISTRMVGYLLCSRQGLSDRELLDILSRDDDVCREFEARSMHSLPDEDAGLPYAYFSRVFYALLPLLSERYSEGERVFRFDQTVLADAAADYCAGIDHQQLHSRIADYFRTSNNLEFLKSLLLSLVSVSDRSNTRPESRYAFELPYQLLAAKRYDDLYSLLCGSSFMQLMHTWGFDEYAETWTRLEEQSEYRISEGFAPIIDKARRIAAGECTADTTDRILMIDLADLLIIRGGAADVVDLLSRARIIAADKSDGSDQTETLQAKCHQAQAMLDVGLYAKALEFSEALMADTPKTETVGYASVLYVYAQSLFRTDNYAAAKEQFSAYNRLAQKLGKRDHIFTSLKWIASCEKALGNLDTALKLYGELEDKYADDGNLSELIPVYFEQATAGFLTGSAEKSLAYCEKTIRLCQKVGNRSWLVQAYHIELCMLNLMKSHRRTLEVFPGYCAALTDNSPGCQLPTQHFDNYIQACYELRDSHELGCPDANTILRIIETYPFMERAGNIVLEEIPECPGKYLFWNGWRYAFGLLPECLQKIILGRTPDYDFFVSSFSKGVEAVYPSPDYAKLAGEEEKVIRDGSTDPGSLQICTVHSYLATLFMHYGYSLYDRLDDEGFADNVYTAHRMSLFYWNLSIYADNYMRSNSSYAEYSFRKRAHLSNMKKRMEALKEAESKKYASESSVVRELVEKRKREQERS